MNRSRDWHDLQKKNQGWDRISADNDLVNMISSKNWNLDLKYCHGSLKKLLSPLSCNKQNIDFFVITDLELGKFSLEVFFRLVRSKYESSTVGGYISMLSYYLKTTKRQHDLAGTYSENIDKTFRKNLQYVKNLQCLSVVQDHPIDHLVHGKLLEGANFIFVHPNIRYLLWK